MMQKVLVIVGPTGVGKTALSIELAKRFQGEIINGDAMQVYRELKIGTAKITEEEKQGIAHTLIDCFHYDEEYNVKIFQERARAILTQFEQSGKLPIVCGGTGLYIKSLLYDYEFLEQEKDEEFLSFLSTLSNAQLYACLTHVDHQSCNSIHPNNRQRMIRALEMAHLGERKSDIIERQTHTLKYDAMIIGLTMNRERLYERINQRVDVMMKNGLLDEIRPLVEHDPNIWERQSFQSIGYKEWKGYFDGTMSIEECVRLIQKNSRNFAKRQYTWFRNQMDVQWYDVDQEEWLSEVAEQVKTWMEVA